MNRRHGMESKLGVGGGTVSIEAQNNLDRAEDLCRRKKPRKALPFLLKAMEDGNNLDAFIQAAYLFPLPEALKALENAEAKGKEGLKQLLGATCFDDGSKEVGKFHSILETRPYMRVLQAQVRLYFEAGQFGKSSDTMIEMLRLCPGDNTSQRTWLGSMLLCAGRTSDALSFVKQWLAHNRRQTPPRGGTVFQTPSSDCLTSEHEQALLKRADGSMLHTAALACFRLWGDCPVARQYLRIAARANPIILTKILAKIEKPRSLNHNPRGFNSPEEAQDYLWLTQNLWMDPVVWEWANNNMDAKKELLRSCSNVNCNAVEQNVTQFKRCAACKEVVYCTQECQKSHWKAHKPTCKQQKQLKDMVRAYQKGKPIPDGAHMASADFANGMSFINWA
ncbi:uncharacterized protein EDB91DRAFT_240724 [Suillus paluster]|uniref:uncharacterized protein n=1 Tax=Suillus paluster TaxID=48578 RepID=UPI001B871241|nr:uncharacterized protein EDB91DRAFT_240724 [Suillus paluster]KAG1743320.1 hypothetical protein EDB91DRAFT_240724 [Suillus paluster]